MTTKRERTSLRALLLAAVALTLASASQADFSGTDLINPIDAGTGTASPLDSGTPLVPGFYPNVELDYGYDDNVKRAESNTRDSTFAHLMPDLRWVGAFGKHVVRVGYLGGYAKYFDEPDENYMDHYLGADVKLDLTQKLDVNAGVGFRRGHETRFQTTGNDGADPNVWNQWNAKLEAIYGRRIATAQIGAAYEHTDRKYKNNGQDIRDYVGDVITLTGYYNLGPRTQLLVEPSYGTYEYLKTDQDNDVVKILAGVVWTATAKTTGKARIGAYNKDFDIEKALQKDTSGTWVDLEVVWEPKTYSTVVLRARRDTKDAALGTGGSYESTLLSAAWEHELTETTELQLGLSYQSDNYVEVNRDDDFIGAYIGISRAITRNITVGARYDFTQRDSSVINNDFDNNMITVGLRTTFE